MRTLIERFVGLLWTIVAAVTIVAAMLISIVRLMLPQIDQQRDAIELWISDIIDRPVVIGQVSASWRGWMPTIDVADLTLLTPDRKTELVRFDYAAIDIAPVLSLRQRDLVPRRLLVGGMRVAFERDANGNISIAGMPPSRWPVAQWLLQQQNFTLRDADITFTDTSRETPSVRFSDVALSITRDAAQQTIAGSLRRIGGDDERYLFSLRASGDILGSSWTGELFVDIQRAQMGPTLALAGWVDNDIAGGELNARLWSRWDDAKLQRVAIDVDGAAVRLAGRTTNLVKRFQAKGMAFRLTDGWSLDFDGVRIDSADRPGTPAAIALRWRERDDGPPLLAFRADHVQVAEFLPLLHAAADVEWSAPADIELLNPRGSLSEVVGAIEHENGTVLRYFAGASVNDLCVDETASTPALCGLDLTLRANRGGGVARTREKHGVVLESGEWLAEDVEIQKLIGDIRWDRAADRLRVQTDLLEVRAETIDISTRGSVTWRDGAQPDVDLVARINSGQAAKFHVLVPKGKLPARGERWLRNAFRSGRFQPSRLLVRGNLEHFPFDDRNGAFKAALELENVDFEYGSQWPEARALTATVAIDGRHVETAVHEGRIYSAPIGGAVIEMPDLFSRNRVVRVRGSTRVTPRELGEFIAQSPLSKTKAVRYSEIEISNDFGMTLDMNLGLFPGGEKEVLGLVHFSGNRIFAKKQRITLDDVSGDVSFTRQDWYGEGLQADFDGGRVGVILNGGLDDPNYDTEFRMTGTSNATQLFKYIERYAPLLHTWLDRADVAKAIEGRLPWKAVLTIPEASDNGANAPTRLTLESSLLGLDVDLPWPFVKTRAEQKPLIIRTETSRNGDRLTRIDFGTTVDIEVDQVKNDDGSLETRRAEFLFGDPSPVFNREPGLSARGAIDRLPLNEWATFASATAVSTGAYAEQFPISFAVNVGELETLGRIFHEARLDGISTSLAWQVNISSQEAVGSITIPRGAPDQPLALDFKRLWLEPADDATESAAIDPRKLPALQLNCDSLRFGNIDLGIAALKTVRVENGLKLESLSFSQSDFKLQGSGEWILEADVQQSRVDLRVHGKTLSGLLKSFDYEVANIDGGETEISIAAGWGGMPAEFSLDKLRGSFNLRVDKGRFLDIEPGGGRLFGLLSLQTLPRRLSLDFNDLFSKGFTFDNINGTFELEHGNAYTNSLMMSGPAARINVSGRTGLADQDYDQHVTVTPALSNTIPVASALFGPAGVGVGAVIYLGQKMFKSIPDQVDKFLSREYSITGPWQQPVIERI